MNQQRTISYQLGTALVAGKQEMVLAVRSQLYALHTLFEDAQRTDPVFSVLHALPATLFGVIEEWPYWNEQLAQLVDVLFSDTSRQADVAPLQQEELCWLAPILYPHKLICIGTNYRDHIAEMGIQTTPKYPYSFLKPATTTLIGSGTALLLPEQAKQVDWEVELAVIIGRKAHRVGAVDALSYVAGYSILNDVSARDWLAEAPPVGVDWVMQKAFDGFAPMGPLITPSAFVADPQQLGLTLTVNGQVKQSSSTANMVFSVREIIEHLTSIMTLEPGDVIATGTPAGVGYAKKPPEFLKVGDTMVAEIEGLGRLETPVAV